MAAKNTTKKKKASETVLLPAILDVLNQTYPDHPMGKLTEGRPFRVLVACIMSLRTRDDMMIPLAEKLFKEADTPEAILKFSEAEFAQKIYPVGFYKTKAKNILKICELLINNYNSRVPDDIETLLTFPGVGRKTANLVVGLGHNLPAVCVDIHVHRICHRLGYLKTKDPEETEMFIRENLPQAYWHIINRVLVRHGQDCCKPINPNCQACPVLNLCKQVDVKAKINN